MSLGAKPDTQWKYDIISIIKEGIKGEAGEWGNGLNEKTWLLLPFPNTSHFSVPEAIDYRGGCVSNIKTLWHHIKYVLWFFPQSLPKRPSHY